MKKIFTLILASIITSALFSQAPPVLAKWTFEAVTTSNTGTTVNVSAGSPAADQGTLTAGSSFTGVHASSSTVWSNPAGNGTAKSVSSNNWATGDYYQFQFSTTGYSGISLTLDQMGSGTGPAQWKVQYSTDGTNFTDITTYTLPNISSWNGTTYNPASTQTLDLSSVSALNNASTIYLRLVVNGTVSVNGGTVASGGTGRVDNVTISGFTIFPVSLISFNASLNNKLVNLDWSTANEVNAGAFELERSANGRDFARIATVSAKNATQNNYNFVDERAIAGTNYYRLKMVDKDGSFKYSQIVSVKAKSEVGVFPNPVKANLTVQHEVAVKGATISVVDFAGKQVAVVNVQAGTTQTNLDASKFTPGSYMIVYINDGVSVTKQFVKQ